MHTPSRSSPSETSADCFGHGCAFLAWGRWPWAAQAASVPHQFHRQAVSKGFWPRQEKESTESGSRILAPLRLTLGQPESSWQHTCGHCVWALCWSRRVSDLHSGTQSDSLATSALWTGWWESSRVERRVWASSWVSEKLWQSLLNFKKIICLKNCN